ncbi:MAG: SPOR domain-containing protein [bacterium]|nr:MAG: SPOR domain-containing protein [bacterium]
MKKLLIYNFLFLAFLVSNSIRAQDLEQDLLTWLEKHSKQELKNRLDAIKRKYPNSPVPLFLEAYIEENGDRAVYLYKQIIQRYPDSRFTDDALLKVAQYYYALGSYVSARQFLDNLVDQFPDSPLVPEAKYLAARCLIATGYYITAEKELKEIIKRYSKSPFKNYAKEELALLDDLSKRDNNPLRIYSPITNSDQQSEIRGNKGKYTIQIGAFNDESNALRQRDLYSQKGYLVTIDSKSASGNPLYLVWVGEFETEDQAAKFGEVFKNLHGISFHVVRK